MAIDTDRLRGLLAQVQLPGLTLGETIIAQAWLNKHAADIDSVAFQCRLGAELDIGPSYPDAIRRQAALNSQKRADMICMTGDRATIVEVKLRVNLGAMGQLLGYRTLWQAEHLGAPQARLVAIGNDALIDVSDIMAAFGVVCEVFPDVTVAQLPPAPR